MNMSIRGKLTESRPFKYKMAVHRAPSTREATPNVIDF